MSALRFESVGYALPEGAWTTEEVLGGCHVKLDFPLEQVTGISERRVAEPGSSALDLAASAARQCLARSAHLREDVDLLISCGTSRTEGPEARFAFEPGSGAQLRSMLGLENALAFDVGNACAGFFTALWVARQWLRSGRARCVLITSGEHLSPLIRSAQKHLRSVSDPYLAALTLGDAGVAVMVDANAAEGSGLVFLDLFTQSMHCGLCVTRPAENGGAVMRTDSVPLAAASIRAGLGHFLQSVDAVGWEPGAIDHFILHQSSRSTLAGAAHELAYRLGHDPIGGRMVNNLKRRGNTASTSQLLAYAEMRERREVRSGDRLAFGVSGSGITVGTALYVEPPHPHQTDERPLPVTPPPAIPIRGFVHHEGAGDSLLLAEQAGRACLQACSVRHDQVSTLIFSGVHRTEYLYEPAFATVLAERLGLNPRATIESSSRTFALDLTAGALGSLIGLTTAAAHDEGRLALVVTSEIDPGRVSEPAESTVPWRIRPGASAFLVGRGPGGSSLEGLWRAPPAGLDGFSAWLQQSHGESWTEFRVRSGWAEDLSRAVGDAVSIYLSRRSRRSEGDYRAMILPWLPRGWTESLYDQLGVPPSLRVLPRRADDGDCCSAGLGAALSEVYRAGVQPGQRLLIAQTDATGQVVCAEWECGET